MIYIDSNLKKMIILFKFCADVENYESFRGFGYIYIYIYRWVQVIPGVTLELNIF